MTSLLNSDNAVRVSIPPGANATGPEVVIELQ